MITDGEGQAKLRRTCAKSRIFENPLEDFGDVNEEIAFKNTRIIFQKDGQVYQGPSKKRCFSKIDVEFNDLYGTCSIPTEALYPEFRVRRAFVYQGKLPIAEWQLVH